MTMLHVLFAPRAEGCPRLALDLIDQERIQTGERSRVAFLVPQPDDLTQEFRDRCESVHFLDWRRRGFTGLCLRMRRLLSEIRPTGVICYTIGHHVPVSLAAKLLGIPAVVHVGNAPPADRNLLRKFKFVFQAGSPFVKMHLACSDVIASDCRSSYKLSNVQSVPNGIEISKFVDLRNCSDARVNRDTRHRVIGMVASLSEHKDHAVLIEAMSILRQRGGCQRLVLAGAGPELPRLQSLAAELGVGDRIDWLGNVNDVRSVLTSLDLFAFATTRSEGLGIALVEAMSAGIPIVASDVPACREVLEGGRWGRLVTQRDAAAWADALSSDQPIPVPPIESLARYDVRQTYRTYSQAINS